MLSPSGSLVGSKALFVKGITPFDHLALDCMFATDLSLPRHVGNLWFAHGSEHWRPCVCFVHSAKPTVISCCDTDQ